MKTLFRLFDPRKPSPPVTVVSGLPRSGTSMMMKILEAGGMPPLTDELRAPDDDNPKGYYELERAKKLKEGDRDWLPEAQGKVVKVISALLMDLPPGYVYQVIFMRRPMPEILASQRKMMINREQNPDEVTDEQLARLYEKHLNTVVDWLKEQPHFSVFYVDYTQMVREPARVLPLINAFLGNTLEVAKMQAVIDPGLYRQRK